MMTRILHSSPAGKRSCLGILIMVALLGLAPGPASAQIEDRNNAAYWYQRAFAELEKAAEVERDFEVSDFDAYYAYIDGTVDQVPAVVRRYMSKLPRAMDMAHRAARRDRCDWHLDHRQGPALLLPHLATMRSISRELNYDAHMRMRREDGAGAAKNMATVLRMSGHASHDRIVISSLVSIAIFSLANETMREGFDKGVFGPAEAATMLRAIRDTPEEDPFGVIEAVAMEQEMMVGWLAGMADDFDRGNTDTLRSVLDWSMPAEQQDGFITSLQEIGYARALDQFDQAMTRLVKAFEMSDHDKGKAALDQLTKDVESGLCGPLSSAFVMSFDRVFATMLRVNEMFAKRKAMLEEIVGGQLDADDLRNAAKLYLEAIEKYQHLSEDDREVIGLALLEPDAVDDAEIMLALEAADDVLKTIAEATALERCDFVELNRWVPDLNLVPDYVPGLNHLWRLVHVRASHALDQADVDTASDSLAMTLHMTRHMEHAGPMPRAMLAHHWFRQAVSHIERVCENHELAPQQKQHIARLLERISRRDPFGYSATHEYVRKNDTSLFGHIWRNGTEWQERIDEYDAIVNREWDAQYTLYFAAIDELFPPDMHDGEMDVADDGGDPFAELRDLAAAAGCTEMYDAQAASTIIEDYSRFADAIAAGDVTAITERPDPPQISAWARWNAEARLDLRRASALLPVVHSDRIDDRGERDN